MFHTPSIADVVEKISTISGQALNYFQNRFGKTLNKANVLRFVYAPREGWGYSRIPLFIVSEKSFNKNIKNKFGIEESIHGDVHEVAHFWWSIAKPDSSDDWINEGFAEYSAFAFSREIFGKEFENYMIKQYLHDILENKSTTSIIKTEASSPDRYVNRYEKVALIILLLEKIYGKNPIDNMARALLGKYRGTNSATSEDVFMAAKNNLDNKAAEILKNYIIKEWTSLDTNELAKELGINLAEISSFDVTK